MATKTSTIESLIERGRWADARKRIDRELKSDPDNHWLLTQLGVTLYEERRYREALVPLLKSLEIVPDCPLTLWNVAGALDALGESKEALLIYSWLLKSEQTADADECWENAEWADALKTDCVYRAAVCEEKLGRLKAAQDRFHHHVHLVLGGGKSLYSIEDDATHIRAIREKQKLVDVHQTVSEILRKLHSGASVKLPTRKRLEMVTKRFGVAFDSTKQARKRNRDSALHAPRVTIAGSEDE